MRIAAVIVFIGLVFCGMGYAQSSSALWDGTRVSSMYFNLSPDSLAALLQDMDAEHYFQSSFLYDDGQNQDSMQQVGLRLRGNTSLYADKKSFKVSFNTYVQGRRYQGVKKLNLIGMHNDPTLIRQKLWYDTWNHLGRPERRSSFVKLYINGVYRGLYTCLEEMDKDWLTRVFGEDTGNLYKCTYPADLVYLGSSPTIYQNLMSGSDPVYDLKTNENTPDFSDLVSLIQTLDQPAGANFLAQLETKLNVDGFLYAYAMDVASGNWDDYMYNANNYFIYKHSNGKFQWITYDTDNSFGIDWVQRDWATRPVDDWSSHSRALPLAQKLLDIPSVKWRYFEILDSITRFVTCPDSLFPKSLAMKALILPAVVSDTFRSLDYGYDMGDFDQGFTATVDGHSPYGILPFLQTRCSTTTAQLGILMDQLEWTAVNEQIKIYPNPLVNHEELTLEFGLASRTDRQVQLVDALGRICAENVWPKGMSLLKMEIKGLPDGMYWLRISGKNTAIPVAIHSN